LSLSRFQILAAQNARFAFLALLSNRLRSVLTLSGISIGIAAIIVILGLGQAAQSSLRRSIQSFGENLILIFAVPDVAASNKARFEAGLLSMRDVQNLKTAFSNISTIAPQISTSIMASYRGNGFATKALGITSDYQTMGAQSSRLGRNISTEDVARAATVAVLSFETSRKLFAQNLSIGRQILINKVPFQVIGVQARSDPGLTQIVDEGILIPITTARKRVGPFNLNAPDAVQFIAITLRNGSRLSETKKDIRSFLQKSKSIQDDDPQPFTIRSTAEFAKQSEAILSGIKVSMGAIAAISLFVGILGVVNMLLVSVAERTSEIGLRMAVGARPRDIRQQFLAEAVVICGVGNIIGIILGLVINLLLARFTNWDVGVSWWSLGMILMISFILGLVAGYYPALKASLLNPIDALRRE
jgi:putative ABC transport system permease protein